MTARSIADYLSTTTSCLRCRVRLDTASTYRGYLVLCSAGELTSGACEATIIEYGGATRPLARAVNGQPLTSAEPIKSAAATGLVVALNAGPPFLGTIGRAR